jgi:hypothetical protein
MKTTVTLYAFRTAFVAANRESNFSYEGLEVLFDYLQDYEDSTGEEIELDVIGLCCEYSEDTWQNIANSYGIDLRACETDEERDQAVGDWLSDEGVFVGLVAGGFVYRNI